MSRSLVPVRTLGIIAVGLAMAQWSAGAEIRHGGPAGAGPAAIQQGPRDVPVTCQADVVVAGGGVSGVAAALRAAADGCSVVLVEERNCLGYEAATRWSLVADGSKIGPQFPTTAKLLAALGGPSEGHNKRIRSDPCRTVLHRLVAEQARIRVFFYSLPAGVVLEQGRVQGLVVANRAGRQVFSAKAVVDATDDQRVAVAAGATRGPAGGPCRARRALVVDPWPGAAFKLPAAEFSQCEITPWQGLLVLFWKMPGTGDVAADWSKAQATTLDKAVALREALTAAGAKPKSFVVSPEVSLLGRPAVRRVAAGDPRPAGVEGLTLAAPPSAVDLAELTLAAVLTSGEEAGRLAAKTARTVGPSLATQQPSEVKATAGPVKELLAGPDVGIRYPVVHQEAAALPVSAETDVLVIGGGTSGSFAAIAAARQGARVIVVDSLPNLGGTSSNRVNGYYWGVPWQSQLSEDVDVPSLARRRQSKSGLGKIVFSGEEKKVALQQLAAETGVTICYRSLGTGAVVEGNRVVGAVIEDGGGRHVIRAGVVIDATGQADIAAAAGAAFHVGRSRDGFLHEAEHGPLRDALDPEDISKVYLRIPPGTLSLNIRESRRIEGDCTVTFPDVLTGRRFPDVIARWRSNYDTHFPHSANEDDVAQDWAGILGLFRKPLWGSIPYRAILPKGLEGLLVVGKAYSTTHDALIGGRMQRDLQHLGEAAGVAAAMACRKKTPLRAIPIDKLQAELVRLGVLLPEDVSEARVAPSRAPRVDLAATAARLGSGEALDAMVELYLAGGASVEHLLPLMKSTDAARQTQAALLLGMLGRPEAVPVLLERLRERDRRTVVFTLPNASSHYSVPLYYSAVILLGRQRVREAAGPIAALLADPKSCPPNLASLAIVALGRIGDKSAVPAIKPYLDVSEPVGLLEENRRFEVHWGVRTNAARALAQLGDLSGVPVLVELLEADQSRLRNYAQRLLEEITSQHFGKDRQAWQRWWQQRQASGGR